MKVKTKELTGAALDWAVAKCDRDWSDDDALMWVKLDKWPYSPSADWEQGGPMIERERIAVTPKRDFGKTESGIEYDNPDGWLASKPKSYWQTVQSYHGPTPLIAAMRCFVASRLGNEIDVPDELVSTT